MITVNEYFQGNVKSLALKTPEGPATVGVIAPGEYEFGTSTKEIMTVISGDLQVQLPGSQDWKTFGPNQSFIVETQKKFKVKAGGEVAYLCLYR